MRKIILVALLFSLLSLCGAEVFAGSPDDKPYPSSWSAHDVAARRDKKWTLVVFGDAVASALAPYYAVRLEKTIGIPVEVKDWTEPSSDPLLLLRQDEEFRRELASADAVFFTIPRDWFSVNDISEDVIGALPEKLAQYKASVDAILSELVSLRSPLVSFTRTIDAYGYSSVPEIHQYWSAANQYLTQVGTENLIPVAKVYEVFNGLDGSLDPVLTGYLNPELALTEKGANQIIRILAGLGWGYGLFDCS